MKKLYSIVLMAAALLIGTNAWAGNVTGNNRAALQAAIDAAASGTTLTLQNDFTLDGPIWLGTAELNGDYKTIILDLNGHKISMAAGGVNSYMFVLTHGELLVRNSSATQALIELTGNTGSNMNTQIFTVFGSYKSSRWNDAGTTADDANAINTRTQGWFSHLEIGQNVKIVANSGVMGTGIAVDELFYKPHYSSDEGAIAAIQALGHTINYTTNILGYGAAGDRGLAQGVRVDVYGDIEIPGKGEAKQANKAYCIKVNGMVDKPTGSNKKLVNKAAPFASVAYVQNYVPANHAGDTVDVPFIYVHSSAKLVSDNKSTRSTAVYSSGYSKMLIEGYCEGAVGVFASSGIVEINDAEVVSTSNDYVTPTNDGGAHAAGSAVVVNSRDGYTGEVALTISGDSKITASTGYAIEEVVTNNADTTKVESVSIEGGTIEGGDKGAIIVSNPTASSTGAEVVVYGGNVTGNTQVGATGNITDILPKDDQQQATAHVTVVTDPDTGKQTIVVSDGATPPAAQTEWDDIMALAANANVNWTGTTAGVLGNGTDAVVKKLGEVQMTAGTAAAPQQLTVKSNATLEVKHLIMNKYAQITVEPGAKLIVTGDQGIVAPVASNIVLKNEGGKQAIFLFNPAVTSNRHPNATVEWVTKSWRESSALLQWERFGIPSYEALKSITCETAGVAAGVQVWTNTGWQAVGYIGQLPAVDPADLNKPFATYNLLANRPRSAAAPKYKLEGELVGNVNAELEADLHWTPFANSYTAEVDLTAMLTAIKNENLGVYPAIYLAVPSGVGAAEGAYTWKAFEIEDAEDDNVKMNPMQAFILLNNGAAQVETINYASMVYAPAVPGSAPAPARRTASARENTAKLRIFVTNEEGISDNMKLRENANVTAFEKFMNDDVNIYAMADMKASIVAAEDINNTYVGFSTVKGGKFTISFANVEGREFTLVDHETGARVAMVEGNTYEFTAAANSTNDYRFEIVESAKLPTAIENTEAVKSAKGVYTITGQYVGEMNVWNTLPAGIYVVNGEKRVK